MPLPDPFPVARYRLHFEVTRAIEWPEYEGSALRGLFGHALRSLVCVTGQPECSGCALLHRCAYPALFEPPASEPPQRSYRDITAPYVLEPPLDAPRRLSAGERYAFDLVLVGRALGQLPLLLAAWQQALGADIGPARGAAVLRQLELLDERGAELLLDVTTTRALGRPAAHTAALRLPLADAAPGSVTLELLTPVRIKRDGKVLGPAQLDAPDLLFALVRRIAEFTELHLGTGTGFDFAGLKRAARAICITDRQLHWRDWSRWSNRQQQHMPLGGVVGRLTLTGELGPFWPLLHLGGWLHVGGKSSFGHGRYRLLTP